MSRSKSGKGKGVHGNRPPPNIGSSSQPKIPNPPPTTGKADVKLQQGAPLGNVVNNLQKPATTAKTPAGIQKAIEKPPMAQQQPAKAAPSKTPSAIADLAKQKPAPQPSKEVQANKAKIAEQAKQQSKAPKDKTK